MAGYWRVLGAPVPTYCWLGAGGYWALHGSMLARMILFTYWNYAFLESTPISTSLQTPVHLATPAGVCGEVLMGAGIVHTLTTAPNQVM